MSKKSIDQHLRRKYNEWARSLPKEMLEEVDGQAIITGGCIVSLLTGEPVNDYDIYFRTKEFALRIAEHYVEQFNKTSRLDSDESLDNVSIHAVEDDNGRVRIVVKSAGVAKEGDHKGYRYFEAQSDEDTTDFVNTIMSVAEDAEETKAEAVDTNDEFPMEEAPYRPIFLSSNAITLSGHVQLVIRFYGSPRDIHENFDFVHCTNYWLPKDGLHLNKDALTSILTKQLEYTGSKYPICSLFRLRKFIHRGWKITAGQILKIALQVSDLDLNSIEVLEDQLIGVDVAYFAQLIERLKSKDPETVDRGYLIEILDQMFDDE